MAIGSVPLADAPLAVARLEQEGMPAAMGNVPNGARLPGQDEPIMLFVNFRDGRRAQEFVDAMGIKLAYAETLFD